MKTLEEIKAQILAAKPKQSYFFNDEEITLSDTEFENAINKRAEMEYDQQMKAKETADVRAAAEAKLATLGLTADDLKALGLGGN